jgi:hypothetical protein
MRKSSSFGHLCVMTREQYEDMLSRGLISPIRFLGKNNTPSSAFASMRHYAIYFNHVCVWDMVKKDVVGVCSQTILEVDSLAPRLYEYISTWAGDDKGRTYKRKLYAYPHPSGTYERND